MSRLTNPKHEKIAHALAAGATEQEAIRLAMPNINLERFNTWMDEIKVNGEIKYRVNELKGEVSKKVTKVQVAQVEPEKKKAPAKKSSPKKATA